MYSVLASTRHAIVEFDGKAAPLADGPWAFAGLLVGEQTELRSRSSEVGSLRWRMALWIGAVAARSGEMGCFRCLVRFVSIHPTGNTVPRVVAAV